MANTFTFEAIKDPEAVLDYTIDWTPWLNLDTIISSTWSITQTTPALTIDSDSFTVTGTTIWLSGGTRRKVYDVVNHITTAAGREDDRTIRFTITDK